MAGQSPWHKKSSWHISVLWCAMIASLLVPGVVSADNIFVDSIPQTDGVNVPIQSNNNTYGAQYFTWGYLVLYEAGTDSSNPANWSAVISFGIGAVNDIYQTTLYAQGDPNYGITAPLITSVLAAGNTVYQEQATTLLSGCTNSLNGPCTYVYNQYIPTSPDQTLTNGQPGYSYDYGSDYSMTGPTYNVYTDGTGGDPGTSQGDPVPAPEPSSVLMLGSGLLAMIVITRRRVPNC